MTISRQCEWLAYANPDSKDVIKWNWFYEGEVKKEREEIFMEYVKELRAIVGHRPLILPGSVVLIVNQKNELLLQHRNDGGWGLPGGLMELGESLEDTARREVKEETGLNIGELRQLGVFSGPDYFFKVANGDELYSVTAVFLSNDVKGEIQVDETESVEMQFFNLNSLPSGLTDEYRSYITPFIDQLIK